ncbi:hypothetical protein B0H13DRAFT_2059516 [Mycena leptocephala]|nr:hypothetical protein B0H13DRAFT_2059516 [Mycena leptocephala]
MSLKPSVQRTRVGAVTEITKTPRMTCYRPLHAARRPLQAPRRPYSRHHAGTHVSGFPHSPRSVRTPYLYAQAQLVSTSSFPSHSVHVNSHRLVLIRYPPAYPGLPTLTCPATSPVRRLGAPHGLTWLIAVHNAARRRSRAPICWHRTLSISLVHLSENS